MDRGACWAAVHGVAKSQARQTMTMFLPCEHLDRGPFHTLVPQAALRNVRDPQHPGEARIIPLVRKDCFLAFCLLYLCLWKVLLGNSSELLVSSHTAVAFTCKTLTQHLALRKCSTLQGPSVGPRSAASRMPAQDWRTGKLQGPSPLVPGATLRAARMVNGDSQQTARPRAGEGRAWMLSRVQLFATPRTEAHQALLSLEFSKQACWSRLPCPPLGDLPERGTEPLSLVCLALAGFPGSPGKRHTARKSPPPLSLQQLFIS